MQLYMQAQLFSDASVYRVVHFLIRWSLLVTNVPVWGNWLFLARGAAQMCANLSFNSISFRFVFVMAQSAAVHTRDSSHSKFSAVFPRIPSVVLQRRAQVLSFQLGSASGTGPIVRYESFSNLGAGSRVTPR